MTWNIHKVGQRIRSLPSHLNELSDNLAEISSRVRTSIGDVVGNTAAQIVRDTLKRLWSGSPGNTSQPFRQERELDPGAWPDPRDDDGWDFHEDPLGEADIPRPATDAPSEAIPLPTTQIAALALKAAGWYLYRRGSWWGALGVGCGVGGLAIVGGQIVIAGWDSSKRLVKSPR